MDPGLLTERRWKASAAQLKLKDNGLQRSLAAYEKLDENQYVERLKALTDVSKFIVNLKKAKEVANSADAARLLDLMIRTLEMARREIAKALAQEKTQAMTQKRAAAAAKPQDKENDAAAKEEEEEEEERGDQKTRLLTALQKLKSGRHLEYQYLVCDAKPFCGVIVAKRITPKHKEELTRLTGGSKRFLKVGTCHFEDGHFAFETDQMTTGLARKIQLSIKNLTGKKLPLTVGQESVEEDDEETESGAKAGDKPSKEHEAKAAEPAEAKTPDRRSREREPITQEPPEAETPDDGPKEDEAEAAEPAAEAKGPLRISGSVGRGGRNKPEDVQAVQAKLNEEANAGLTVDGKCGPKTISAIEAFQKKLGFTRPDGLVEPGEATERALNGERVSPPEVPGPPKPAGAGAGVAAADEGGGKAAGEAELGNAPSAASEAALKAARKAVQRKKELDRLFQEINKKLDQQGTGGEVERIKQEFATLYKEATEHAKNVEQAVRDLIERKTPGAAELVRKATEKAFPGYDLAEKQGKEALDWLKKNVQEVFGGAKELAKRATKEVADRKKQAEDAVRDIYDKLKNAAEDELGPEGKRIKEEIEKTVQENKKRAQKVAEAAKELLKNPTDAATEALKKAAEMAQPGFEAVEDLAKKAADWWES